MQRFITESLREFLRQRFSLDDIITTHLVSFVRFDANVDLHAVHETIATDLDCTDLSLEFEELRSEPDIVSKSLPDLVKCLATSDEYPNMLVALARVLAAKPHSADVERCISANNLLKTSLRASLNIDTESRYLFVYHNLPPTAVWNPRSAVLHWLTGGGKLRRTTVPRKGKRQTYFLNVFDEANSDNRNSSSDSETEDIAPEDNAVSANSVMRGTATAEPDEPIAKKAKTRKATLKPRSF